MLNHSCSPNASLENNSLIANRFIPKGKEITIDYKPGPKEHRGTHLKATYGIDCSCARCI
jgi:SET domain-containing protein